MEKIFIGNIKNNTRPRDIQDLLLRSSPVIKVKKLYPKKGRVKKGFAIFEILLKKRFKLKKFLKKNFFLKDDELFLTKYLSEKEVQKRNHELKFRKLHVSGLPDDISDEQFFKLFEVFGEVETAYISRDRYNKKKIQLTTQGEDSSLKLFGFVTFKHPSSAQKCYSQGNNTLKMNLEITKFTPRNQCSNSGDSLLNDSSDEVGEGNFCGGKEGKLPSIDDLSKGKSSQKMGGKKNIIHRICRRNTVKDEQDDDVESYLGFFKQDTRGRKENKTNEIKEKRLKEPFVFESREEELVSSKINFSYFSFEHWGRNIRFNLHRKTPNNYF